MNEIHMENLKSPIYPHLYFSLVYRLKGFLNFFNCKVFHTSFRGQGPLLPKYLDSTNGKATEYQLLVNYQHKITLTNRIEIRIRISILLPKSVMDVLV